MRRGQLDARLPLTPHVAQAGQDFGIALAFVGLLARKGQHLPQGHSKGPHITFGRKLALNSIRKIVILFKKVAINAITSSTDSQAIHRMGSMQPDSVR